MASTTVTVSKNFGQGISLSTEVLLSEQSTGLQVTLVTLKDDEVDSLNGVGARKGIEQLPPKQQHCIRLPCVKTVTSIHMKV